MRVRLAKWRLDQLIYMSTVANRTWQPAHARDLPFGWEAKYLARGQRFSPFAFARNASMVLGAAQRGHRGELLSSVAAHLDEIATPHIHSIDGHLVVVNGFDYQNLWTRFLAGFYGALQNAFTAYGYIHLFEATEASRYLERARALLHAVLEWRRHPLSGLDEDGQFWLYEYVFRAPPEDEAYVERVGFRKGPDEHFRASVFNGHLLSMIAFARYEAATNSDLMSSAIESATATMRASLSRQIYEGRYFSYMKQFAMVPDYDQRRAIRLARGLAEMYPDDRALETTVARMEDFYECTVAGRDQAIVEAAQGLARDTARFVKAVEAAAAADAGGSVAR